MTETETEMKLSPEKLSPEILDLIRRLFVVLSGGDPEAQQTLNAFLKFNNNIERTNLPTRRDVHTVSFLDLVGKSFFPDLEDDPFSVLANCMSIAFMAKGGEKSNQFVELMKKYPSLDALTTQAETQRGFRDRLLGRSPEGS